MDGESFSVFALLAPTAAHGVTMSVCPEQSVLTSFSGSNLQLSSQSHSVKSVISSSSFVSLQSCIHQSLILSYCHDFD